MDALDDPACYIYDRFFQEFLLYDHAYSPVQRSYVHTIGKGLTCSDITTVGLRIYRSQPLILFQRNFFLFFRVHSVVSFFLESNFVRTLVSCQKLNNPSEEVIALRNNFLDDISENVTFIQSGADHVIANIAGFDDSFLDMADD